MESAAHTPCSWRKPVALTKCPHCGHSVLSVASHCPACSGPLGQFLGMDHEGELAECRSCGHPVRSKTASCPHCGTEHPARRPASRFALPVLAAAVVGGLGLLLAQTASEPALPSLSPDPVSPPEPVAIVPIQAAPPVRDRARDPLGDSSGAWETPAATPENPPEPATEDEATGLITRWVADWSNLRRGPSNEAPIVRVLPPGTMVRGSPSKWGWWAIQWQGDTVGYIAGALLRSSRPPGTR